ncbi:hypothetical protein TWF970_007076 [Orbilia oligospora]|uniref:CBM1 domain-containing protein n=1 Tax=Orbilia oligospora TaxID=2813651 RepID=A0A7C8VMI5_ORBOL|nr:hypothetical protein TWF970_007076 [Orbilia oligospora]
MVPKVLLGLALAVVVNAQAGARAPKWGQCGGLGFLGPTICVSGTTCNLVNASEESSDGTNPLPDGPTV